MAVRGGGVPLGTPSNCRMKAGMVPGRLSFATTVVPLPPTGPYRVVEFALPPTNAIVW